MKRLLLPVLVLAGGLALFLMKRPVQSEPGSVSPDASLVSETKELAESLSAVTIDEAVLDTDATTTADAGRVNAAESPQVHSEVAEIVLRVVSREKKQPLAGVRILLTPHEPASVAASSARFLQAQQGVGSPSAAADGRFAAKAGELPITNAVGVVRLSVATRTGHRISASGEVSSRARKYGKAGLEVPALESCEQREVELQLATKPDVHTFGRLIADDEHATPVTGARIRVWSTAPAGTAGDRFASKKADGTPSGTLQYDERPPESKTTSRGDGTFELEVASWLNLYAWIEAPGRSPSLIDLPRGHDDPGAPLVVRLSRAGRVRASILDQNGSPARDIALRLSTPSSALHGWRLARAGVADPAWQSEADAAGRCTLGDLPSNVPLTLELVRYGKVVQREVTSFVLTPGEEKRLALRLGEGAR